MRGVAIRLILVIGSTALSLLVLEGLLREFAPDSPVVGYFPKPYDMVSDRLAKRIEKDLPPLMRGSAMRAR
jgi:hypothetical protein